MSRFELKIALAFLVTAAVPLAIGLVFASRLVEESVAIGLNPRVREAVQAQVAVVRDLIRGRVAHYKQVVRGAAESRALSSAVAGGDRDRAERYLRSVLASCEHCSRLELTGPLAVDVRAPRIHPADAWVPRSFPSADDDGLEVPGRPGARLRLTAVLERRYLEGLREAGEFAKLYALLAEKSDAVKRAYLMAFGTALGVTMAVALTLGIFFARRVTRRIAALTAATRRVARGELAFEVPVQARDEISELTRSFNRMLADLSESQRRIVYLETIAAWQEIARRLAHEIKNPLTPILLAVQQVHKKYTGDDPAFRRTLDEALEVVTEEVGALRTLVSEFSDFAKLPAVNATPSDLAAFVEEVARGEEAQGSPVALSRPEGPLPASFDRLLLKRALVNLLKNAREAMRAAGVEAAPELTLARDGRFARLEVADRGPGVPPDAKARVFDPYFTTKHEGTGLGLSIVKKIVLDHGGTIEVADRDGGGAVFRLHLPLEER